ncbi:hypothetical protein GWK47_036914 [Chionoecetes opilio]|uniref:Uncharacterized protein n=1 Tax=Chionoecetes opilio TaxID=41210 RepID=A0A8J5D2I0_CHIOP|nr:hypothetical protein GWK47_036914 [Chionoecetes opilio]
MSDWAVGASGVGPLATLDSCSSDGRTPRFTQAGPLVGGPAGPVYNVDQDILRFSWPGGPQHTWMTEVLVPMGSLISQSEWHHILTGLQPATQYTLQLVFTVPGTSPSTHPCFTYAPSSMEERRKSSSQPNTCIENIVDHLHYFNQGCLI